VQEFNHISARLQASLLFLATIALLASSAVVKVDARPARLTDKLSVGLAVLLLMTYGLSMMFSLKTIASSLAAWSMRRLGGALADWLGAGHSGWRHCVGGVGERGVRRVSPKAAETLV